MGLDVYLYTKAHEEANDVHEKAWEAWWEEWGEKPDSPERDAAKAAVPPYVSHEDVPSERHPGHLFNRRYLRSSYNGGGFNRAVPDMVGEDHGLYWIFEPVIGDNPEPYSTELKAEHIGALEAVSDRATQVAKEIRASDPLRVTSVSSHLGSADHMWSELPSGGQVLEWYREETERKKASSRDGEEYGYSTAKGEVFGFTKGLEVLAVTLGRNPLASFSRQFPINTVGGQMGALPQPILVYRLSDEVKDSYIQSAEIAAEFCAEAIELIKRDGSCFMHWSG